MLESRTFFLFKVSPQKSAQFCMAIDGQSLNLQTQKLLCFKCSGLIFFPAGCLALWPGGQAAPQRTCVTCLQKWTLSSLLWPSSTSSTKLCWDLSCTDERAGFICAGSNIHTIFDIIILLMLCLVVLVLGCLGVTINSALVICPSTE